MRRIAITAAAVLAADPAFAQDDVLARLQRLEQAMTAQQSVIAAQKAEIARLRSRVDVAGRPGARANLASAAPPPAPSQLRASGAPSPSSGVGALSAAEPDSTQSAPSAILPATGGQGGARPAGTLADDVTTLKAQAEQQRLVELDRPRFSMNGVRPTFTSADGRYSISLRALVQADFGSYGQGPERGAFDYRRGSVGAAPNRETTAARDLSDGGFFRRARLGFEGVIDRDWAFRLIGDFGGSGTEGPARISDAWVAYVGFSPFTIQVGAYAPPAGLDDATSAEDTLFLERASPAEISRALAGADGRMAATIRGNTQRLYGALSLTGRTVNDAEVDDSQTALIGRVATLAYTNADWNVHAGLSGTYVLRPADQGSSVTPRYGVRLRDRPEVRVDSTRLIDTGTIDANSIYSAGVELAANWRNFYAQGEYFWYGIDRRASTLPNPGFSGGYVQASWVITGETRRYDITSASWRSPRPRESFNPREGGWGAFELAARYSHTDLDYRRGLPGTLASPDAVRGGVQDGYTIGLNWYPTNNLRFALDYQREEVDRLNPASRANAAPFGPAPATPPAGAQIGQGIDIVVARVQLSF